ncbi:DHA2 family efflux MFS transporter permease subunit [Acinetobacter qingfengensis]|uniref:Multidrug resistance protein B n=1 Tax=Acinetobacter qingfengensis TaxID=1262585 RepID=A0A1E7RDS1_9GAMM|nr:DHA2 family efflux MFS transporter permease subunit [Acinetobacter qingfengensis]KAA8735281.1 DHA2 family efflux MFS transporter permease subunit [Acinetobacter qingfengensis]OEY97402.1 multidrug resistance protein B [Acinetobacter qingfengensis]
MKTQIYPTELQGGRLLIAALFLALANFMVVLDMTIANVSLTHISGGLAVSSSQGTWIITSYAVAEAICVPLTGWLAGRFGAVRTFIICLIGFTTFSVLCGLSNSLAMLVICRIGQGFFGGPIMPLSQTLLMRIFPQDQHPKAMAIWSLTTVIGPILGPILGGTISDNWSWHWIFFINLPIGLLCAAGIWHFLRVAETQIAKLQIDVIGLTLLILWIGALQLMLDLGHEHDWFNSNLICGLAGFAIVGFITFCIWELTEENPVVDLRIFRHIGFSSAVFALAFGFAAFFGCIVIIPQWLQSNLSYTASWAGYVTATMGFGSILMSPIVAKWSAKYDPRKIAFFGLIWLGAVTLMRAFWTNEADFWVVALPQFLQGFGVPMFFIPLSNLALASVLPQEIASAAGLMSFLRTMAGAIGASVAVTIWDDHAILAHSEIVSRLNPELTLNNLIQQGFNQETALGVINDIVTKEAVTVAADHVFLIFVFLFLLAGFLVWLAPKPKNVKLPEGASH